MRKKAIFALLSVLITLIQAQTQCPLNCKTCTDTGICIGCASQYTLNLKGRCQPSTYIDGCLTYSTQTTNKRQCQICSPGRILILGKCIKTPKHCQSLDELFECKKCEEGYELVGRNCLSKNISNCPLGHFPFKNYCRHYPQSGCKLTKNQSCEVCSEQNFLVNGVCLPKNCCQKCQNCSCRGTILFSTCLNCKPNNCVYSQNNLHCSMCQPSYSLIHGQCYKPVKSDDINCNLMDVDQICTGCNHDYKLDRNNYCVRNFMIQDVRRCQDHRLVDFYQGECFYRDRFCEKIDSRSFQCLLCQDGFDLKAGRCERIQKCAKFAGTQCIQCISDYYLSPKKQCQEKPKNCLIFNVELNQCSQCKGSTSMTSLTSSKKLVCAYADQKCTSYNMEGYCVSCETGFILKKWRCAQISTNCQTPHTSDPSSCMVCIEGFRLQDSQCYQNIKNCIKYGNNGNCSQCSKQLLLYNNRCIYMDKYCLQADENGNCMRCSQGLIPYGNKCVYYQSFCDNYGYDRICNQTYTWFQLKSDVTAQAKQEYRLFVLSANQAKQTYSYSLASETKIRNFDNGQGFYFSNGMIQFYPNLATSTKSIKSMKADYSIIECREQYELRSGVCIKKQKLVEYCKEYNVVTFECVLCEKGFDMGSNSKCEARSEKSCADRELSKESCLKCNVLNGYFNAGGWCISKHLNRLRDLQHFEITQIKIMWPLLPNCDQQKNISKCQICLNRYTNRQGKCVLYQKYCESYHPLGFCQKCVSGYSFEGGNCIVANCEQKSVSCKPGFQYQGGKCFPQRQANCAIYTNFNCTICQPQYFLSSVSKKCEPALPNCAIMNEISSQCKQCNQNYILYRQRCLLQTPNCKDYTFDGKCMVCQSSPAGVYQLISESLCIRVPNRCARLNKLGVCQFCETGYSMTRTQTGNQCVVVRQNCKIYDQTGRCSACNQNFALRNGLCESTLVVTVSNCKEINSITKKCSRCWQNYQLNDGVCIVADINCKEYRNGLCQGCSEGYFLSANICEAKPLYCQSYNYKQKRCEHCISTHILAEGICISKGIILNGCIDQNLEEPACLSCQPGFRLKDGLCYAHNCLTFSVERNCAQCPTYYRKSVNDPRICEPHFCKAYSRGPSCDIFQANYKGGFLVQDYGVITVQFCKDYDTKTRNCIKCDKYRTLQLDSQNKYSLCLANNCVNQNQIKCSQCRDGFVRIDTGACSAQHCSTFNQIGQCTVCENDFVLNQRTNLCEMRTKFCSEFDKNKNCAKCMDGYMLTSRKICVAQIKGCRSYGSSQCYACFKGLQYKQGACKPMNCLTLNEKDSTTCTTCKPGYELTPENLCKPKNCEMFSEEGWSCNGCYGRFSLSQGVCQTRNCAMFSVVEQSTCLLCEQNFDLVDGGCLHKNCMNPKDTTCKSCVQGWVPDFKRVCIIRDCLNNDFKTGECTACKQGKRLLKGLCVRDRCLSRLSNIIPECTLCQNSFYLANQRQYCVAYFCKIWDQTNGECWQCAQNFYMESGKCVSKLCKKFENTNPFMPTCTSCPDGYNSYAQYCVPQKCEKQYYIPLNSTCQKCVFGYEPIDGVCKLSNCRDYKQNVVDFSICVKCRLGFANHAGLCLPLNCEQFLPQTIQCSKCNTGFYQFSDICLAINCQVFSDQGECTKCQSLYRLTNQSTCSRVNCLEDTLDTCLKCEDGYEVEEHTGGFCQPVNCQRIDEETNTCNQCLDGYFRDDGICKDLHCEKYSSTYDCTKCKLGFKFSTKQLCELAYPNFCPLGQFYSEVREICEKISIPNCKHAEYNEPNVCIDCMENYFLQNGFCYSFKGCTKYSYQSGCSQCDNGFKLVDNRCFGQKELVVQAQKKQGCQIVGNNGDCQICKRGFVKSGKGCVTGRQNCIELNDKGGCTRCMDRYHVRFDGYCYENGQFCLQANLMGHCQRCAVGYQVNSTTCTKQQVVSITQTFPTSQFVTKQASTQQQQLRAGPSKTPEVGEDSHLSFIDHCLFQDDFKEVCIICDTQYYITANGKCLPMPDNCKFVNMQGICFYCEDGFQLDKNICVASKGSITQTQTQNNNNQQKC